ncbi:hypothetical protein HDU93_000060 [Gonapodya sp. JEL0774]|nr:hypothetical protein HDU93_000060 [Gonapodya sp. JEL0774]
MPFVQNVPRRSQSTRKSDAPDEVANARLMEAVEFGNIAEVRTLLGSGRADANTCKRVTQRGSVIVRRGGIFSSNTMETVSDTVRAESALVVAVRNGRVDLARALLEAGANPNATVQWSVANFFQDWDMEAWETKRWFPSYSFSSALVLALQKGTAWFSGPGGHVQIPTPRSPEERYSRHQTFNLRPKIEMVLALLAYGAEVTDEVRNAAKRLDPVFAKALESIATVKPSGRLTPPPSPTFVPEPTQAVTRGQPQRCVTSPPPVALPRRTIVRSATVQDSSQSLSNTKDFMVENQQLRDENHYLRQRVSDLEKELLLLKNPRDVDVVVQPM